MTVDGTRDILGLWMGAGGEGTKFWLQVLTEIKNRGIGAFHATWEPYPATIRLWDNGWAELVPVPGRQPRDPPGDLLDQRS